MPPVIVPIVHVNVLATLAVKAMLVPVPLQIVFVPAVVTVGAGFTVTVIVKGVPGHEFTVEVGVTTYCIVPAVVLLGLVSV
jgi:plastocyanin